MKYFIGNLMFLPMLALAQSQLTSAAIDSAVTSSLEIKLLELNADLADIEVAQTNFLHTLIPRVSVSARVGQSSVLFLDPTHPWSFPSDAFSAVISLDLDRILNSVPHQQAAVRAEQSKVILRKRSVELRQEILSLMTQIAILDSMISSLQLKWQYRTKLLEAAELKYNAAKISFEELVQAKMDVADTYLQISTQKMKRSDLHSRLSTLLDSSPFVPEKERSAIP
ncbi:MAG: TolC family protein [Bacteroidetes bacterium]|nr:TolC family protein [Bacteroidota bacterium]